MFPSWSSNVITCPRYFSRFSTSFFSPPLSRKRQGRVWVLVFSGTFSTIKCNSRFSPPSRKKPLKPKPTRTRATTTPESFLFLNPSPLLPFPPPPFPLTLLVSHHLGIQQIPLIGQAIVTSRLASSRLCKSSNAARNKSTLRPPVPADSPPTAFGLHKGNSATTASSAVNFVSDQDFSLRKTFHIINSRPPPPPAEVS